ncbi:MFS transporter [Actinoplanes sp. NPDC051633]|uniref:MFS transporter n=1 Tax=Actinoplanes sp. NPDC051633 TaxID=3155670 RepID=UPI003437578C
MAAGVFEVREFRAVWGAEVLSIAGDQLARVALAVLVFARTGSARQSAAVYALTFLPAMAGGVLLGGLADRFRRRELMVTADVLRAVLTAVMALPGLPLPLLCGLLVVVVLAGTPFTAAQGALLPEVLPGGLYERGLAVRQITGQTAQLAGFATGGLVVAALGTGTALLLDAATFLASATLLRAGLRNRARPSAERSEPGAGRVLPGLFRDPARRRPMLLAWLVGCYVVPEALAAPYAGGNAAATGLLMAADPGGSIAGVWLFVRYIPETTRRRLVGPLAVAAGLPLVLCAFGPGLAITAVLWALSGVCSTSYLLQAQADFVRATPGEQRGRAIGIASAGLIAGQGTAILAGGLLADWTNPVAAVVAAGLAGAVLCAVVARTTDAGDRARSADR